MFIDSMIFERMVLTDRISEIVEDQILLQSAQFGDRLYKVFKLCNQSNGQKMKPALSFKVALSFKA